MLLLLALLAAAGPPRTFRVDYVHVGTATCIMFTRDDVPFCAACRAAIDRILDLYAPRSEAAPGSGPAR